MIQTPNVLVDQVRDGGLYAQDRELRIFLCSLPFQSRRKDKIHYPFMNDVGRDVSKLFLLRSKRFRRRTLFNEIP